MPRGKLKERMYVLIDSMGNLLMAPDFITKEEVTLRAYRLARENNVSVEVYVNDGVAARITEWRDEV